HDVDEIKVTAMLSAQGGRSDMAHIWFDLDEAGAPLDIDTDCTCRSDACSHIVAALRLVNRLSGGREWDGTAPAIATAAAAASDTEPYPEPSLEALEWLENFDPQTVESAAAARKNQPRLLYLLRPEAPARLALGKSRPAKTGGMSKPALYRPQAFDLNSGRMHENHLQEDDLLPLRLFLALQAGNSLYFNESVEISSELGGMLLRCALQTGRLYLDYHMDAPLTRGAPLSVELAWVRAAQGLQQLTVALAANRQLIASQPAFYLDAQARILGELKTELPGELMCRLLQAPLLNEADASLVRKRLARVATERRLPLPLPETPEMVVADRPAARLELTMGTFRHMTANVLHDEHAIAELYFDYPQGFSAQASEQAVSLIRHQVDGEWKTLQRDVGSEVRIWRLLQDAGLESYRRRLANSVRIDSEDDCLLPTRQDNRGWLPLLNGGLAVLEAQGVEVRIADDFPYCMAEADDWFVAIDEEPGSDWFNLDLGVSIGGKRISLVPPLLRLLREQPRLLTVVRDLQDHQTYPVAVDERHILPVPANRLKAWLLPLLELLDGDKPRLSRHNAVVLFGLNSQPAHWIGGENLRALAQRLRDFSGMETYPPAPGFTATLRPYQQAGLDWLQFLREYGLAGILADDMGLGKTVQTLAHLHLEKVSGRADRPCLVVATTSLMSNWRNEAAQFAPELKVLTLHGKDRAALFSEIDHADIILTTYPLLVRDRDVLLARDYHVLVMDEAQFIKNPKALSHQVARQLRARHRLSLTGTPLENHLGELWAQYDFLMPGMLGGVKRFNQLFRVPIERNNDQEIRARLAERVRPFLLRRTKEEVLSDLPPRSEMVRWVEVEGGQRDLYESLRVAFDKKLRQALVEQGIGRSQIMILDALLKLRQVCCDPRLVKLPAAEALVKSGGAPSAKLATLMEMLEELLDEGRKVLLFSQFTSMLELIEQELALRQMSYVKLTGETRDRETPIREFQENRVPLFLISLKAGGTGLNLTAADTVIHYDPWWNPAVEEQATARAHRIGQDKPVFVYKLMTQGTVEEKILALQGRKRGLADQLMKTGGDATQRSGNLITAEDLDVLFQPLAE
ncbi:MAG TPA: DEAD/DEAH box helicase, partial [Rhodocyclaceae bacterium]|nr:DEAD/DEAH box helicase [Rhodocyclaceae bacterium]